MDSYNRYSFSISGVSIGKKCNLHGKTQDPIVRHWKNLFAILNKTKRRARSLTKGIPSTYIKGLTEKLWSRNYRRPPWNTLFRIISTSVSPWVSLPSAIMREERSPRKEVLSMWETRMVINSVTSFHPFTSRNFVLYRHGASLCSSNGSDAGF